MFPKRSWYFRDDPRPGAQTYPLGQSWMKSIESTREAKTNAKPEMIPDGDWSDEVKTQCNSQDLLPLQGI